MGHFHPWSVLPCFQLGTRPWLSPIPGEWQHWGLVERAASQTRRREVRVEQDFCWGWTGPSAFYRLFKQLTSINQSGASSAGREAGKAGGACWEAGERRAWWGRGAAGAWGQPGHQGYIRALGTRGLHPLTTFLHLTSITPAPSKIPRGNYKSSLYPHCSTGPGHGTALRPSRAKSRPWLGSGGPGCHPAPAPSRSVTQTESPTSAQHCCSQVRSGEAW